jgi:signal transduction histidine kinase
MWADFKKIGHIDLSEVAGAWRYLALGRAVAISNARTSGVLPRDWVERFGLTSLVAIPLHVAGEPCGLMVVDYDTERSFASSELRLLETIGSYAGIAVRNARLFEDVTRRARLNERLVHRAEVLHDLGRGLGQRAGAETLVKRLNDLLTGQDVHIAELALKDRTQARELGAAELTDTERTAWRHGGGCLTLNEGTLSVPMRAGRRLIGALRVRPDDADDETRGFLETLAHAVAEVIEREALQTKMNEAARERAVASERGRIAADLHDTAGQMLVAIGLLSRREAEQLPSDSPWADRFGRLGELAEQGKWEIDRAIQALSSFPAARRGLSASLRTLARSFEADSGIRVQVDIKGSGRLPMRIEQSLYRVAHEALTNAWRHSRCDTLRIALTIGSKDVELSVVDDGLGIRSFEDTRRSGVTNMRRALEEVGGTFRITNIKPHGTAVDVHIPREGR